jgi:hypothetical protein
MIINGSTESTGVVYDLISEGPIELVGGLSGIYLNRTPIVNPSAEIDVQSNAFKLDNTVSASDVGLLNATTLIVAPYYPNGSVFPVIIVEGLAESTIASVSGTTVNTSSSFFTTNMINGNLGEANLVPKLRIQGGNLDGTEYVGSITAVASGTQATVFPAIPANVNGKRISFDFYTTGTVSSIAGLTTITVSNIPNYSNLAARSGQTRIVLDSLSNNLPGSNSDNKNFNYVLASFRSGTLNQSPVLNIPTFTNASLGINKNQEIKQLTDYFNRGLNNFWGKYTLKRPTGATGGPSVTVNASEIAPGSVNEVDELLVTISAPSGLYAANDEGRARTWGCVFQIFFKYKNGNENFKSELIYGPTDAEINAATILVSADNGTFRKFGPDPSGTIKAASKSAIDFDFRWSIEQYKPFTDFQIEIKKVTPDNLEYNNDIMVAATTVKSIQAFINDKLSYPHAGYAAIAFDSLEFGGEFPERAYRCRGVPMDLPTNYVTREEASDGVAKYTRDSNGVIQNTYQIWDGSYRRAYSNNPVWCLKELLINKRWGLGHWVDDSMINKYSFYSLARYCDELVPDGNGGLEPRFTCAVYLTQPTEAYKVIRDFCTTMLAIPYWVDGEMIIEGDRPAEPIYTFTKGNIEGGIFSYEGTGNKTRPNQIAVRFNDKDNFYEQDLELVDDVEDMIKNNRIFTEEVVAFGATTRGQAARYGKWKLLTSKLQKEVVSFKTGENAAYLRPGSIINIQDADRNSVRYSGRLISATNNSFILDSNVSLFSGEQYTLHVFIDGPATYLVQDTVTFGAGQIGTQTTFTRGDLLPSIISGVTIDSEEKASQIVDISGNPVEVQFVDDAHLESKPISTVAPYTGTSLSISGAFTKAPEAETVWAITVKRNGDLVAGSTKQYKVLGINEESEGVYSISAAEHYNSKFDLIDEEYLSSAPRIVPRYIEVPPVTDFSGKVVSSKQTSDDIVKAINSNIELTWVGPRSYVNNVLTLYQNFDDYLLEIVDPYGVKTTFSINKNSTTYTLNNVVEGRYDFTLRARSSVGPISLPSRISVSVSSETFKPSLLTATLPKGGTFSKPISIQTENIATPSSYRFTAESGISIVYSQTPPAVTPGTYWSNGASVFLRELIDGVEVWTSISGAGISGAATGAIQTISSSAFGTVGNEVAGQLNEVLGSIISTASGSVSIAGIEGTLSRTLDTITSTGSGDVVAQGIGGSLDKILDTITSSASGDVETIGTATITLDTITSDGSGFIAGEIAGSLNVTLATITSTGSGDVGIAGIEGTLDKNLDVIVSAGSGDVTSEEITGSLDKTLDTITSTASGDVTGAWSPADLFTSSQKGCWLDPSDIDTLFQDAAGTTPVTATGQPVGLILDKSGNGNHWSTDSDTRRPTWQQDGSTYYLEFDGSNDILTASGLDDTFRNVGSGFVALAHRVISNTSGTPTPFSNYTGTADVFRVSMRYSTTRYIYAGRRLDSDSLQSITAGPGDGSGAVQTGVDKITLMSFNTQNRDVDIYVNNALIGGVDGTFQTAGLTSDTDSQRDATLGGRVSGTSILDLCNMRMYGLIVRGVEPTSTDRSNIQSYWETRI